MIFGTGVSATRARGSGCLRCGKRWRVRWVDPETGKTRTEMFGRRADAERHDANMHADISRGQYVDPRAGTLSRRRVAALDF